MMLNPPKRAYLACCVTAFCAYANAQDSNSALVALQPAEENVLRITRDGRIVEAVGTPKTLLLQGVADGARDDRYSVQCKTFDMRAYLEHQKPPSSGIPGVLFGPQLIDAWHDAQRTAGRQVDQLFFCLLPDGVALRVPSGAVSTRYVSRRDSFDVSGREGLSFATIRGSLVIGVVAWGAALGESSYLSGTFQPRAVAEARCVSIRSGL